MDYGMILNESKLLAGVILSGILLLAFLAMLIFWILFSCRMAPGKNQKDSARIRKLRALAETDGAACKELEKRLRKVGRERKHRLLSGLKDGLISGLLAVVTLACLALYTVPVWQDYFVKDYAVYTGTYTVTHQHKAYWIELEDGTTLQSGGAPEGEYTGTVIYARRSKIVVGLREQ